MQIPLSDIHVAPNFNPRRHFKPQALDELIESIKANGLCQPLLVRPRAEGGVFLIAGERRLRAMRALNIENTEVMLRDIDEKEARSLSLVENCHRSDVSPAEEALALRALLDAHDGDRGVAKDKLGWSDSKIAARLLLLHASIEVLDALAEGQIGVGIAEILSGLPEEQQNKALPRIIERKLTVAEVKASVETQTIPLNIAAFNRGGCVGCPHNSATQASLFTDSISTDRCANRSCFEAKTRAHIAVVHAQVEETFNTVVLRSERDEGSVAPLTADGPSGVGAVQFSACKQCRHFAALIEDRIGSHTGSVQAPSCLNVVCRSAKIADRQAAEAAARAPAPAPEVKTQTKAPTPLRGSPARKPVVRSKKAPKNPAPAALRGPVVECFNDTLRRAAAHQVSTDASAMLVILGVAMSKLLRDSGVSEHPLACDSGDMAALTEKLAREDTASLKAKLAEAARCYIESKPPAFERTSIDRNKLTRTLVTAKRTDLAPFVTVDRAWLGRRTKSEIEQMLEESGFSAKLRGATQGEVKLKALLNQRNADMIEVVMASGFDFQGYVPSALRAQVQGADAPEDEATEDETADATDQEQTVMEHAA